MKKRIFALLLCLTMIISLVACGKKTDETPVETQPTTQATATPAADNSSNETTPAPTVAAEPIYTAGTYSATEQGFGGAVKVTITVSATEITDVTIEGDNETAAIGGAALADLAAQAKSGAIDGVAGATVTSTAAKTALEKAIAIAKGEAVATDDSALTFTAGTYEGTGIGYNGPLTVSVTFSDTAITAIEVVSSKETADVANKAIGIITNDIIAANGTGVDGISGATFSSRAVKEAVNAAADAAAVSNKDAFVGNKLEVVAKAPIEETWDVVIVGAGGAGISAAAQAAQDGNTVLVIEKNAEIGGNTLVSGGQYQSVMKYLVWDAADPDATTGVGFDGNTYNKVKSVLGCINELKTILNWNESEFDADFYKTNEYVAGDIAELSKHGVHADYLPTLLALKDEIRAYLAWAQPQLDAGVPEGQLTLFSTVNLHIFQTYFGGLRQSADGSEWIYGNVDLVTQFITDGQDIKPWLEAQGATFVEDTQPTLIGALWYRENQFIGANADVDGDGTPEEYKGRWGTYFMAPYATFINANAKNEVMLRTTANELIVENGAVVGVKATQYDGTEVIARAAKGVILATGGYAANISEVLETNKYWSSEYLLSSTKTTNRSSLQGDGMKMAAAAGADIVGTGWTQLMPISWVDNGNLAFGGGDYAIYLNPNTGHRFVDETSERDVLSLGEFRNGIEYLGAKGVFIEIANASIPIPGPYPYNNTDDVENRQYIRTISGLADLFTQLGFPTDAEEVIKVIRDYDNAIMTNTQPMDVAKKQFSALIGTAEKNEDGSYNIDTYNLDDAVLRVRIMAPSTHHTMGGIAVDVDRHALTADGQIIKGLYAAGEVTGGIHGGNRLGGNAITEIIVSGRTAAKAVTADNQ